MSILTYIVLERINDATLHERFFTAIFLVLDAQHEINTLRYIIKTVKIINKSWVWITYILISSAILISFF